MFAGTIRKLELRDCAEVGEILDQYWSGDFRKRLSERLDAPPPGFERFVAEENGEIVGVAALRPAPERMKQFAQSDKVVEFYVAAAKYKGRGIGTALRNARIAEAKKAGYEEAVFFGGENHKDAWAFHDRSAFVRAGEAVAPDGEKGVIWLMRL